MGTLILLSVRLVYFIENEEQRIFVDRIKDVVKSSLAMHAFSSVPAGSIILE